MERQLIVFESGQWQLSEEAHAVLATFGTIHKKICSMGGPEIGNFFAAHAAQDIHAIFIPSMMVNESLFAAVDQHPLRNQIVLVEEEQVPQRAFSRVHTFTRIRTEDLDDSALLSTLLSATATQRAPGVKAFLERGSAIYSENIFNAKGLGQKLDPCFQLAASHLGETRALHVWTMVNLFVNHALSGMNSYLEDSSNKRVKLQLAADGERFCFSVSYPVTDDSAKDLYFGLQELYTAFEGNEWLAPWREAGYMEVSHYHVSKRGEIIAFVEKRPKAMYLPFVVRSVTMNEMESPEVAKAYTYKLFTAIKEAIEQGDTKVVTGAVGAKPKLKLSERMKQLSEKHSGTPVPAGTAPEAPANTVIKGVTQHINNESTIKVAGSASKLDCPASDEVKNLEAALNIDKDKTVVPAATAEEADIMAAIANVSSQFDDEEDVEPAADDAAASGHPEVAALQSAAELERLNKLFSTEAAKKEKDAAKILSILEDRLQSAKDIINQREKIIKKLYKQIDEIMDPTKSGVISGVMDNQKEGLKNNVSRLEADLVVAGKREKELMTSVDKAVQARDEALKRVKALEVKLQSEDAALTRLPRMEKALEEEKRQKAELMKRLSALGGGKKAA